MNGFRFPCQSYMTSFLLLSNASGGSCSCHCNNVDKTPIWGFGYVVNPSTRRKVVQLERLSKQFNNGLIYLL